MNIDNTNNWQYGDIVPIPQINREEYEKELAETQRQHRENIRRFNSGWKDDHFKPCLHDGCTQCHGTGVKLDGTMCVHMISCPCPKCTPTC